MGRQHSGFFALPEASADNRKDGIDASLTKGTGRRLRHDHDVQRKEHRNSGTVQPASRLSLEGGMPGDVFNLPLRWQTFHCFAGNQSVRLHVAVKQDSGISADAKAATPTTLYSRASQPSGPRWLVASILSAE